MTKPRYPGLFFSFEGTEGSGKSTQMRLLADRLRHEGFDVTLNQEPGATQIGRQIRRILLDPANEEMAGMTELLLVFASRAQAAQEIVRPALERGDIVLSDRFTDSTLAYQGEGRAIGFERVLAAHRLILGDLWPDRTLYIAVDVETGLSRAHKRNAVDSVQNSEARLDRLSLDFHRRVAEGYRKIASLEPERVRLVDGQGNESEVAERVWRAVEPLLPSKP